MKMYYGIIGREYRSSGWEDFIEVYFSERERDDAIWEIRQSPSKYRRLREVTLQEA